MLSNPQSSILQAPLGFPSGSSDKIATIQRRIAWPLRKDDTHESRQVFCPTWRSVMIVVLNVGMIVMMPW